MILWVKSLSAQSLIHSLALIFQLAMAAYGFTRSSGGSKLGSPTYSGAAGATIAPGEAQC